jgi:hypothetical protein
MYKMAQKDPPKWWLLVAAVVAYVLMAWLLSGCTVQVHCKCESKKQSYQGGIEYQLLRDYNGILNFDTTKALQLPYKPNG